jgi:hypothetical protein
MVGWENGHKDEQSASGAENQIPIFISRSEIEAGLFEKLDEFRIGAVFIKEMKG